MKPAVFAIVANPTQAEEIIDELRLSGFSVHDISIISPDQSKTQEGVVPGISVTDDLSEAWAALGFSKHETRFYAGNLEGGHILIAVHTENRAQIKAVREIFERADAHDIGVTHETVAPH